MKMSLGACARIAAILTAATLFSGCASFPGGNNPQIDKLPDKSAFTKRPSITLDVKMVAGNPDAATHAENKPGTDLFKGVVDKVTKDSAFFSSYSLDPFKSKETDYTIKMEMLNHGSGGAAAVSGLITGFTLGVIPGAATDHYRLTAKVMDRQGTVMKSYVINDEVTTWIGIWFIPFMGSSPQVVVPKVWTNMVKNVYQQMENDKLLPYAALPVHEMVAMRF